MKKNINGSMVQFYDDNNHEIMYIDHSTDECIWYFDSDSIVTITPEMELYNLLDYFMEQEHIFSNSILQDYKDKNKLIWYSDCYFNPDDKWSVASVSCLHIERTDIGFKIWCTKQLDELIKRTHKSFGICFSPAGNGKFSKNSITGLTLQDDFVTIIYHQLLNKECIKKLK